MSTGTEQQTSEPTGVMTWSDSQRQNYGGDMGLLATLPEDGIHPETKQPIRGTRGEIRSNGVSMKRSFFRGDLIFTPDPTFQFHTYAHYDDGSEDAPDRLDGLLDKGYSFCEAEDWSLSTRMEGFWAIESGRLIQRIVPQGAGVYPTAFRLMFCSHARFLQEEKMRNANSDDAIGEGQATDEDAEILVDSDKTQPQRLQMSLSSTRKPVKSLEDFGSEE